MRIKMSKFLSLLLIIGLLTTVGAGAALAQDMAPAMVGVPGDGPANAVMPSAGNVQIAPGAWQWYVFRSQVPQNVEDNTEDVVTDPRDATIDAVLRVQSGNVDFEVWSTDDFNRRNDTDFEPTGAGTVNEFMPSDPLSWQGSFEGNNNYYLIVKNRGLDTATYALDITGDVRFPSNLALNGDMPSTAMAAAQTDQSVMSTGEMGLTVETPAETAMSDSTPTSSESTSMAPVMNNAAMATGPESAVMPAAGTVQIAPGTWQWYSFRPQIPFGAEEDETAVVTDPRDATIDAVLRKVSGNVDFEVWSKDDLNNWRNGVDFEATGAGTVNEFITGDPLSWQGSFERGGTYYLIVKNRGPEPATYFLSVTGDVSFPTTSSLAIN
jgi:hypothetical protein